MDDIDFDKVHDNVRDMLDEYVEYKGYRIMNSGIVDGDKVKVKVGEVQLSEEINCLGVFGVRGAFTNPNILYLTADISDLGEEYRSD